MAGARRIAMAGLDPLAADLLASAVERGEGSAAFQVAGQVHALGALPMLIQAVRPDVLIVGSPDDTALPDVCARFLADRADRRVVVLVTPTFARAMRYPGQVLLEQPSPAEILAALDPV